MTYAGVPTNHADIPEIQDTDTPSGALFCTPDKRNLDLIRHTQARADALEAASVGVVAGNRDILIPAPYPPNGGGPSFTGLQQTSVGTAGSVSFPIPLPRTGKIKAISVTIQPNVAHVGVPATKPTITLFEADFGTTSATVATATDASASAGAYNPAHVIQATGLNWTLRTDRAYYVTVTGEAGANALTGLVVVGVTVTIGT